MNRRELLAFIPLVALAFDPLQSKLKAAGKEKPVMLAAGDDLRVSFEGATLPSAISPQTMTFNYTVPDGTLYTATVDFIPSNMHPGHWDGTVIHVGPEAVEKVILHQPAEFSVDIEWKHDDVCADMVKQLYERNII
jgi:hypothetical protein